MRSNIIETAIDIMRWISWYWKNGDWKRRLAMLMPPALIIIYIVLPVIGLSDHSTHAVSIFVTWMMIGPWFFSRL
jgi:hypothetical protein